MDNEEGTSESSVSRRRFLNLLGVAGVTFPLLGQPVAQAASPGKDVSRRTLNLFSKRLGWMEYEEFASTTKKIGFDGVDLTVRSGGHVEPDRVAEDLPRAVRAIRDEGLKIPMMVTDIADADDPLTEKVLRVASDLGIRYYRMDSIKYDDSLGVADTLQSMQPQFRKLAELNRKYNIHGAYQNHAGTRVGAPTWDIWLLIRDLDPRYMGCQYDIRHATAEGGNSWPLALDLIHPHVKTLVIKDFRWVKEQDGIWDDEHFPVGTGMVDFDKYFKLVKKYNLPGPITIHYEHDLTESDPDQLSHSERKQQTVRSMRRDLDWVRGKMEEHGL